MWSTFRPLDVASLGGFSVRPVALFCQGMPGPVVLFTNIGVMLEMRPDRARHDASAPTWPARTKPVFAGASLVQETVDRVALATEDLDADEPRNAEPVDWDFARQIGRSAASFSKPAHALLVGDYLQTHDRYPADDRDTDEGFHRVGWVGSLAPGSATQLFTPPEWSEDHVTVVVVDGFPGLLVLPNVNVQVLILPNPEREAEDICYAGEAEPFCLLPGMRERLDTETAAAQEVDARLRPTPPGDEADLYPRTVFGLERELLFHGQEGIRLVPLSDLPWPHLLGKCDLREWIGDVARTYPSRLHDAQAGSWNETDARQAAAAEAFGQIQADDGFTACDRHQANWAAIGAAATELVHEGVTDASEIAQRSAADERLTESDRSWLYWLFADPIMWDDGDSIVANGQHRICALRAASVELCPVQGRHLPATTPPTDSATIPAAEHASRTVQAFWTRVLADRYGTNPATRLAGRILARHPRLRRWISSPRIERY